MLGSGKALEVRLRGSSFPTKVPGASRNLSNDNSKESLEASKIGHFQGFLNVPRCS